MLAFSTSDGVYLAEPEGPLPGMWGRTRLAEESGEFLTWSPDGRRLAFLDGSYLYVVDVEGGSRPELLDQAAGSGPHDSPLGPPSWAPDGRRLAYNCSVGYPEGIEVCVLDVTTGSVSRLTDEPGYDGSPAWSPAWSPDGTQIAFASDRAAGTYRVPYAVEGDLYVMDAGDGSNQRRLTRGVDIEGASGTVWLLDGRSIAFPKEAEIYATDSGNPDPRSLAGGPGLQGFPTPSPDGERLAFVSGGLSTGELRVIDADGANEELVATDVSDGAPPSWSPDGRRIAYEAYGYDEDSDIMVVGLDGSEPEAIFTRGDDLSYPAWRPTTEGERR